MTKIIWRNALLVGAFCGALEALLVWSTDLGVDRWLWAQGIFFWLGAGMVVYMADSGLPSILHGISLTVLLNLPWYVALAIAPGQWALLPPLLIARVIFGCLIGWLRSKLHRSAAIKVSPLVLENVKSYTYYTSSIGTPRCGSTYTGTWACISISSIYPSQPCWLLLPR